MTDDRAVRIGVPLPTGRIEVPGRFGRPENAWATIVVAHGAGAGHRHPFLAGFCEGMQAEGVATLRFDFAYIAAGRRMPGPASHAILAWRAAYASARRRATKGEPAFAAGKSYGGRMASMAAAEGAIDPAGLVYLGYPLHPPGRPDQPRVDHLPLIAQPQLFVEGTNDAFVDPHDQLEAAVASCQRAALEWVEGGGHSFEVAGVRRSAADVGRSLAPLVAGWMRSVSVA